MHPSSARDRSVAIAGFGVVTPLGVDVETTWAQLKAGCSGVGTISKFDARGFQVQIAGEVRSLTGRYHSTFLDDDALTSKEEIVWRALDEAMDSAGLSKSKLDGYRVGVFSGCENEGTDQLGLFSAYDAAVSDATRDAVAFQHDLDLVARRADAIARRVAGRLHSPVVVANYAMACAAGAVAITQAVRWIRRGRIDCAIVIGADTPINSGTLHGFQLLDALSTQNENPAAASRPFDGERDGFVLAEGAAVLVLLAPHIRAGRNTHFPRIIGVGMSNNRHHFTNTPRSGEQAALAMALALHDASLSPDDIDYINAHGTSTDVGDVGETSAIRRVFRRPPPVSSTKSMTGHLVAAAGAAELIFTCLAVTRGFLPPTINQTTADSDCDLDYIANQGRVAMDARRAMSNSFGFGGTNISIIVERA